MMGCCVLDHKALVSLDSLEDARLLHGPFTNIGPLLFSLGVLFLGVRWFPSRLPVVGELLKEWSFE